ncbi:MAG: hypothetical protein WD673_04085 [Alphaproteobacteria bacterium]
MALFLQYTGYPEDAIERLGLAMRINPLHPSWYWEVLGLAHMTGCRYEDAVKAFAMIQHPASYIHAYRAACLAAVGRMDEARVERARLLEANPAFRIDRAFKTEAWASQDFLDHLRGLYKAAGLPE